MSDERTISQAKDDEGFRSKPYRCSAGKLTIGYGRNLEDRGITKEEADYLLRNDIAAVTKELQDLIASWYQLTPPRQAVLINMGINMGVGGLLKFRKMLAALDRHDYKTAAAEMLNSTYAKQVPNRANRLAQQMETGQWVMQKGAGK